MLMYFMLGKLPWQGLKAKTKEDKYQKILNKKVEISIDDLCKGCPEEFATYLKYCRQLKFGRTPDYKYLRNLFYTLFRREGFKDDCIYDWMHLKEYQTPDRMPTKYRPENGEPHTETPARLGATDITTIPTSRAHPISNQHQPIDLIKSSTSKNPTQPQLQLQQQQQPPEALSRSSARLRDKTTNNPVTHNQKTPVGTSLLAQQQQ
jgi:hypothetical protein